MPRNVLVRLNDSTMLTGCSSHWTGSAPGQLLVNLSQMGVSDPVILLDEIDKLGGTEHSKKVQYALLHILDPAQNHEVQDNFLNDIKHDFSRIWFICAMNNSNMWIPALRDRLEIIDIPAYTNRELTEMIPGYVLPALMRQAGHPEGEITITAEACQSLLARVDVSAGGVRSIQKALTIMIDRIYLYNTMEDKSILSYKVKNYHGLPTP